MFRTPILASLIECTLMGMNSTFAYVSTSMNSNMEMAAKKDKKKDKDDKKSTKKSKNPRIVISLGDDCDHRDCLLTAHLVHG